MRSQLSRALEALPDAEQYLLTSEDGTLAHLAAVEWAVLSGKPVRVLLGGTRAWVSSGLPLEHGKDRYAVEPTDRYRRPYEGTNNPVEAMQGYLDWEYGLVDQLGRDGTHGFFVLEPEHFEDAPHIAEFSADVA